MKSVPLIAGLILGQAFGYEADILLLSLCAAVCIDRLKTHKDNADLLILFGCVGAIWTQLTHVLWKPAGWTSDYWASLNQGPLGFNFHAVVFVVALIVIPLTIHCAPFFNQKLTGRIRYRLFITVALINGLVFLLRVYFDSSLSNFWNAYHSRAYSTPMAFILAGACFLSLKNHWKPEFNSGPWRAATLAGPFVIATWMVYDVTLTQRWIDGVKTLAQQLKDQNGCIVLPKPKPGRLAQNAYNLSAVTWQSLLIFNDSWTVQKVAFFQDPKNSEANPCQVVSRQPHTPSIGFDTFNSKISPWMVFPLGRDTNFDWTKLMNLPSN
ncbi:MAG: hypothetical protein IT289_11455 [Oligoflexia bacterium]|nr:hypothetical protein [Oligoflexia bacterium]